MRHDGSWKDDSRTDMPTRMAYCDYIAHTIVKPALEMDSNSDQGLMVNVSHVTMDLHPKEGWMRSTVKTINCSDINGKEYKITIEEI